MRKPIKKILVGKTRTQLIEGREVRVSKGRTYYLSEVGKDFHTNYGAISKRDLSKKDGSIVRSASGREFSIISPSYIDQYRMMRRVPQMMPLKDIGHIIAETGIGKSSIVVDAGSGSGGTALFLANLVKHVHTYEIRKDHAEVVRQNIELLGAKNVTLKEKDVSRIDEKNVDLVVLDLPTPWEAIKSASKALRHGGFLVSYSPMITQTADFVNALLNEDGFLVLKTVAINEELWEVAGRKVRPKSLSNVHSGFLTFARKIK